MIYRACYQTYVFRRNDEIPQIASSVFSVGCHIGAINGVLIEINNQFACHNDICQGERMEQHACNAD